MSSSPDDSSSPRRTGHEADGTILVLKVWRDPAFKARITVEGPGADPGAQTLLVTSESAVVDFVREWLGGAVVS